MDIQVSDNLNRRATMMGNAGRKEKVMLFYSFIDFLFCKFLVFYCEMHSTQQSTANKLIENKRNKL